MSLIRTKIEELRISSVDAAQEVQEAVDTHSGDILNPHNVTKTQVGLSNVDNTSDANKPVSTATQTALDLKADITTVSSHTSNTSNPHSVTKTQVELGNVDNTSDANKPVSTATQTALDLKANQSTTYTKTETDNAIAALVDSAPTALNTLNELAAALGDDVNFSTTVATNIGTVSSNLSSHSSNTSNPHSVTKAQVGLGSVDNTSDASKPISTAQQTALNLKADSTTVSSHTSNTSNPHSVTKTQVGLGNADNTADIAKPVSTATQAALDLKSNLTSPTFTGTVSGITKAMVGLGSVDNTSDVNKPVSTAQQTALDLKATNGGDIILKNSDSILSSTRGAIRYNPTSNTIEYYDGSYWRVAGEKHGLTINNPAPSGFYLAQNYPSYVSGWYYIQSYNMPNPLLMYVDMTEEGGGYDFYKIENNGINVNNTTMENSGTALGLDLVYPRSKYHWRAMSNFVRSTLGKSGAEYNKFFNTTYSITGTVANHTGIYMRDHRYYGTGSGSHWVRDGGRFWLRDTAYSEPNGDFTQGCLYTMISFPETYSLTDLTFNDATGGGYTGTSYLVSTNAKP